MRVLPGKVAENHDIHIEGTEPAQQLPEQRIHVGVVSMYLIKYNRFSTQRKFPETSRRAAVSPMGAGAYPFSALPLMNVRKRGNNPSEVACEDMAIGTGRFDLSKRPRCTTNKRNDYRRRTLLIGTQTFIGQVAQFVGAVTGSVIEQPVTESRMITGKPPVFPLIVRGTP